MISTSPLLNLLTQQINFTCRISPRIGHNISSIHARSLTLKVQEDSWKILMLLLPRSIWFMDRAFLPSLTVMQVNTLQSGVANTSTKYVHLWKHAWRTDLTDGRDHAPSSTHSSTSRRRSRATRPCPFLISSIRRSMTLIPTCLNWPKMPRGRCILDARP